MTLEVKGAKFRMGLLIPEWIHPEYGEKGSDCDSQFDWNLYQVL